MADLPITEPKETTIEEPDGSLEALAEAEDASDQQDVAGRYPTCLAAWAALGAGALAEDNAVEAYAFFRVGYHRGLDRIRKAGWRGKGKVPWSHAGNRGFLQSLKGLGDAAAAIGEEEEATRCEQFLRDLAPDAPYFS